jgi:hypothetical protein
VGDGAVGVGGVVSSSGFSKSGASINFNTSQISHARKIRRGMNKEKKQETLEKIRQNLKVNTLDDKLIINMNNRTRLVGAL